MLASVVESGGVVTVFATAQDDTIVITTTSNPGFTDISVNFGQPGAAYGSFATSSLQNVLVYGGSGDDAAYSSSTVPTEVNGQAGDDILNGGSANDILRGGDGEDRINGRGGDDVLVGGVVWCQHCPLCKDNVTRQEVYITHYRAKSGLQLDTLAVDLPSRSIRKLSPDLEADLGIEWFSGPFYFDRIKIAEAGPDRRVQGLAWDWANENGSTKFRVVDRPAFPKYLKLHFTKKDDTQDFWVFARGDDDTEYYHRIDPKEVADFVWCTKRPTVLPVFKKGFIKEYFQERSHRQKADNWQGHEHE